MNDENPQTDTQVADTLARFELDRINLRRVFEAGNGRLEEGASTVSPKPMPRTT